MAIIKSQERSCDLKEIFLNIILVEIDLWTRNLDQILHFCWSAIMYVLEKNI